MHNPIPSKLELFIKLHVRCSIRNKHDAEDLMQDVRILCLGIFKNYKSRPALEVHKICRVACRNKVRDFIRTKRPKVALPVPKPASINIDQIDARGVLKEIQDRVSPRTKSILYYMERGLENGDIQTLFSVSRVTVHRTLTEARASLNYKEYADALHQTRVQDGNRTRTTGSAGQDSEEGQHSELGSDELCDMSDSLVHSE